MIAPKGGLRSRWRNVVLTRKNFGELRSTVAVALWATRTRPAGTRLQYCSMNRNPESLSPSRLKTLITPLKCYASVQSHFSGLAKSKAINCGSKWKTRNSAGQLPIFLTIGGIQFVEGVRVIGRVSAF